MSNTAFPLRMSAREYLAWEREQPERHVFLDGEVFAMAGGSPRHSALGAAMVLALGTAFRGGPCRVLSSDQRVVLGEGTHYAYPDVSVLCAPLILARDTKDTLANLSIVVEVLS